jgi:Ca2+-binding EF-hand superfamily protein
MVGTPADMSKAEELFLKLDQNSDGSISQEEFITILKHDHDLLNVLENTAYNL